jgi:molecular chaperone DnaK
LESNDTEQIKTASEALQQGSYKLSELLYQQASAQQTPPEGAADPGAKAPEDDGVIDAEFKAE